MRLLDFGLRGIGVLLAVFLGGMSALLEAVYTPYRIGGWPALWLPPLAFGVNLLLGRFARTATGAAWGWWLAAVPWFLVMVFAVGGTQEGDQIAATWLGLLVLAAGGIGFVGPAAYRAGRATTASAARRPAARPLGDGVPR